MTEQLSKKPTLRQIAILLDGLDRPTVDRVLELLGDDDQLRVRDAMVELDSVSDQEQLEVLAAMRENLILAGLVSGSSVRSQTSTGSEDAPLAGDFDSVLEVPIGEIGEACDFPILSESGADKVGDCPPSMSPLAASLSGVLQDASIDSLVKILRDEHPQLLAVVMATLPPARAATFLRRFRSSTQTEILRRVVEIEDADPVILEAMQEELVSQLTQESEEQAKAGLHVVHSIISATPTKERTELLTKLADTDRELAKSLSPRDEEEDAKNGGLGGATPASRIVQPPVSVLFDRFVDLDRHALIEVFMRLPTEVAALALAGASQPCLADVLGRLPGDLAQELRDGIRDMGPIRLSDIQSAQNAAVNISREVLEPLRVSESDGSLKLSA